MAEEAEQAVQGQQEEVEADQAEDYQPIDKLQQLGINAGDIRKAKEGGYYTCSGLLMQPKKKLAEIKGLSEAKVEKLVEAARKCVPTHGWQTGAAVEKQRQKEIARLNLGADALNELLGGGLESKAITEMYGEFRTGKTQLCHTLAVTTQMQVIDGGGAGKDAWIDTENTFRPERVKAIATRFGLDAEAVLGNVCHARAYTTDQQMELLISVAAMMADEPFKLLIVDSITANLRVDFSGRGELAERQQKLGQMMSKLKKISEEFNVAVLVTNQVMSDPSGGAMFVMDPKKPLGGHVMAHASTIRLYLRKGKGEQRVMKVMDSPNLPEGEASYQITAEGVTDYKD